MRKIKVNDLLELDKHYGGKGIVPIMCAKATFFDLLLNTNRLESDHPYPTTVYWGPRGFQRGIDLLPQTLKAGYIFLLMSRWIKHLKLSMEDWLKEARGLDPNPRPFEYYNVEKPVFL